MRVPACVHGRVCVCVCLVTMLSPATLFPRSVLECEKLVRKSYRDNGLVYKSSSEDESGGGGPLSSEVIEIDDEDEDDDVIAVGCRESRLFETQKSSAYDEVVVSIVW